MSKALPITIAVLLGGAALVPVYYASKSPATMSSVKMSADAKPVEKISYALGYEVASQTPPELDVNTFVAGIRAGHAHEAPAYNEEELQAAYVEFQKEMQQKQVTSAQTADSESQKFFAENAKKADVITTASGLQYKITQPGTGKKPTADSMVTVHYKGQLLDGKVFDSSYTRGAPIDFKLNQVIPGWTEGLQHMQEGAKATLYIPAKLAYAERGVPGSIPPNSALIFDVELIKINDVEVITSN